MFTSINRKFKLVTVFAVPTFLACLVLAVGYEIKTKAEDQPLPRGSWTVGFHPYLRAGYDKMPVVVSSVTSKLAGGASVTGVGLVNRSGNPVSAVRLSWYLSTEEAPNSVLLHGQTPLVAPSGGFPAGAKYQMEFPVVSFAKIYKPLLKEGVLRGNFRIEIGVTEIVYEDGSVWAGSQAGQSAGIRETREVVFSKTVARPTSPDDEGGFCPKQACAIDSGGQGYSCQASSFNEFCTNRVTSCTNSICTGLIQ